MTLPDLDPMRARPAGDPRYAALVRRDAAADGTFVYAVRTTGVYCRPSCPARTPRPENVAFYASGREAAGAGFRPCRRCRPDEAAPAARQAEAVARACRMIDEAETPPSLDALARAAGQSPFHFHRVFKRVTGVTPRAYAAARRSARLTEGLLREADSVTAAIFEAGYAASSRFYAAAPSRLGMTPTAYRRGGEGATIRFAVGPCSLGSVLVAATGKGLCAILLGDDPEALVRDLQNRFPKADLIGGDPGFEALVAQVVGLVEAPEAGRVDLPLDIIGTAFQQRVWQALRAIPAGETATYTQIARAIGEPRAVRAVAQACGANPLAVAIPCHRVVRHDGALSGYRWGVERKRTLLAREAGCREPTAPEGER
ncbi:transcriptional regulator, AraC family [Methylobacterium sp. 4-46]|uniref:bifunctional DNA-binding transcriptional regulator/O6-methylguanine-DNA methyltransferase Ada n=1 Tax=unclassified Methylobacterium TaxID=2615210 RepID=UPI000165C688|nr:MULTISPECIES: bifunctional DNA-binding transcriptional regulator/O6-methylguanine-DNA methyltransferase Ada [Methylobacterium]ACA15573.1 transcriptional regulator, AraC family [Methylobacterium sp. 4-46]WFT81285.1 bifunctional DNA-binding transcriptional regulator/O6-methylguanine-DNA methyltransferase Ada [Methylobacterium nodulans]